MLGCQQRESRTRVRESQIKWVRVCGQQYGALEMGDKIGFKIEGLTHLSIPPYKSRESLLEN